MSILNLCSSCDRNEPAEWCWEGRLHCPFAKPPQHLSKADLWKLVAELDTRIKSLEELSRCCPTYPNGPQWGHEWSCPKCPD